MKIKNPYWAAKKALNIKDGLLVKNNTHIYWNNNYLGYTYESSYNTTLVYSDKEAYFNSIQINLTIMFIDNDNNLLSKFIEKFKPYIKQMNIIRDNYTLINKIELHLPYNMLTYEN